MSRAVHLLLLVVSFFVFLPIRLSVWKGVLLLRCAVPSHLKRRCTYRFGAQAAAYFIAKDELVWSSELCARDRSVKQLRDRFTGIPAAARWFENP